MISAVAGLGHLLQLFEDWDVHQGFWYVAGNVAGLGNPLVQVSPTTALGEIIDAILSIWLLVLCGIMLSLISQCSFVMRCQEAMPKHGVFRALILFGVIPAIVLVIASVCAVLLSRAEDWSLRNSAQYVVSTFCGLGNPLTFFFRRLSSAAAARIARRARRSETPTSPHGRFVVVLFGTWALTVSGTVIGLTADVPEVTTGLDFVEGAAGRVLGAKSGGGPATPELPEERV